MLTYGLVAKWHRWLAFSIFIGVVCPDSQTADYWLGLLIHLTKPLKISELVNSLVVICEGTWWVLVVHTLTLWPLHLNTTHCAIVCLLQHVTMEDSYLCGYLKIKGLTEVKWSRTGSDTVYFYLTPHMQWVMMLSWVCKPLLGTYHGRGQCKPSAMQLTSPNWHVYWYNQPMWNWHALWQHAKTTSQSQLLTNL